jgi:hypothetical protein
VIGPGNIAHTSASTPLEVGSEIGNSILILSRSFCNRSFLNVVAELNSESQSSRSLNSDTFSISLLSRYKYSLKLYEQIVRTKFASACLYITFFINLHLFVYFTRQFRFLVVLNQKC